VAAVVSLLATGAQRSGTRYLATVLRRAGVDATHEGNSPDERGWPQHDPREGPRADVDVDVCWHAAWWLGSDGLSGTFVVHLVRDPLASVASSVTRQTFWRPRPSGRWAMERMPEVGEGQSNIERCAVYWRYWNSMVERHARARLLVEHASVSVLAGLLSSAGVGFDRGRLAEAIEATSKHVNTNPGRGRTVDWQQIPEPPRQAVAEMARRYGYYSS
jgi:hypothetical protein